MKCEAVTRHNDATCKMAFGRPTKEFGACARCDELKFGMPARAGWNSRAKMDEQRAREVRAHFASEKHRNGGCGPVCTFGDW